MSKQDWKKWWIFRWKVPCELGFSGFVDDGIFDKPCMSYHGCRLFGIAINRLFVGIVWRSEDHIRQIEPAAPDGAGR